MPVGRSDVVQFAGLSGDYNQLHTDAEFAKGTPYGQRIAHGLLGLSIASGLAARAGSGRFALVVLADLLPPLLKILLVLAWIVAACTFPYGLWSLSKSVTLSMLAVSMAPVSSKGVTAMT